MLKRLKYISRYNRELTLEEINDLVKQSARDNEKNDITGVLMTSGRLFFQVIEGPHEKIDELYRKIVNDERHTDVLLLNAEDNANQRIFPNWNMEKVALGSLSESRMEPLRAILDTIIESRQRINELISVIERAMWKELMD